MISRIMKFFGYSKDQSSEIANLQLQLAELKIRLDNAHKVAAEFEKVARSQTQRTRLSIPIDLGDPSPTKPEEREEYVAKVAELHTSILKPKFEQMISTAHNIIEDPDVAEHTARITQGAIYAFREIINWGDSMERERIANIVERSSSGGDTEDITNDNQEDNEN